MCTVEPSDDPRGIYPSSYLSDVFEYDPKANYWRMARTADMQGEAIWAPSEGLVTEATAACPGKRQIVAGCFQPG